MDFVLTILLGNDWWPLPLLLTHRALRFINPQLDKNTCYYLFYFLRGRAILFTVVPLYLRRAVWWQHMVLTLTFLIKFLGLTREPFRIALLGVGFQCLQGTGSGARFVVSWGWGLITSSQDPSAVLALLLYTDVFTQKRAWKIAVSIISYVGLWGLTYQLSLRQPRTGTGSE